MACHKMQGPLVGPGFKDIAYRYKNDETATSRLESKVAHGGAGSWGSMPMPAMTNVKKEDIRIMIEYVMSQAN